MDATQKELYTKDILTQTSLGFSADEIIENLRSKGATESELGELRTVILQHATAEEEVKEGSKSGIWSIVISILFILRGLAYLSKGSQGLGILMLSVGLIGIVIKITTRLL